MAVKIDADFIRDAMESTARFDRDIRRYLEVLDDIEESIGWDRLVKMCNRCIFIIDQSLEKKGIHLSEFPRSKLKGMLNSQIEICMRSLFGEPGDPCDILIVYADGMGFLSEDGGNTWKVFEGSDEPTQLDMLFYNKLVASEAGMLTLWGMHGVDFVSTWKVDGIPENVYFALDKDVARHYWHPSGDDVLVKVKVPGNAIVTTAEGEFKTIRRIHPSEFKLYYY